MPDPCDACGGSVSYGKCRECGAVSAHAAPNVQPSPPRFCPFDGAILHANGFCPSGSGFPITQRECPDACPACRRALRWDGECDACRPPGYKPGHLYTCDPYSRHDPTSGHWRLAVRGPQPLASATAEQRTTLQATLLAFALRMTQPASSPREPTSSRSGNSFAL